MAFTKTLAKAALVVAAGALALTGCAKTQDSAEPAENHDAHSMTIFATTGYLGDLAKNVAPEADVFTLVKPGGDPHTYQPSTKDIEKMKSSDVVLWNGLHLEAMMIDQLESLGDKQLEIGEEVDHSLLLDWPEKDDDGNDLHDPHIWNSPEIWRQATDAVAKFLGEKYADHKAEFAANADKFKAEITKADEYAKSKLESIPKSNRVLVTGHDAFNYYGATYGMKVEATDFVTSSSEMSATELNDLAKLIADAKIPMIFQDNLKNPQAIKSLQEAVQAQGWDVEVSDKELYADTLGETAPEDTWLGAFKHNTEAISAALTPKA